MDAISRGNGKCQFTFQRRLSGKTNMHGLYHNQHRFLPGKLRIAFDFSLTFFAFVRIVKRRYDVKSFKQQPNVGIMIGL